MHQVSFINPKLNRFFTPNKIRMFYLRSLFLGQKILWPSLNKQRTIKVQQEPEWPGGVTEVQTCLSTSVVEFKTIGTESRQRGRGKESGPCNTIAIHHPLFGERW